MKRGPQIKVYSSVFKNSDGSPKEITLNAREMAVANYSQKQFNERYGNALGYEVSITTLTQISKKISEQKFYEIAPAQYLPIRVGEGTWASNIEVFRTYDVSDIFESGIINTGANNTRMSVADAAVDALNIKVNNWASQCAWSVPDLEMAAKSGNWDLVSSKERSRKRKWDLGIQKVAFIGAAGQNGSTGSCLGLFNQPSVTTNTTLITQTLSSMGSSNLATFQQNAVQTFRANCNYTAYPTHLIIPENDYNGLAAQSSPSFPIKSTLALLEEGFQIITRNEKFKILPNFYASYANVASGTLPSAFSTGIYTFLNYDEESVVMYVPLPYTNTLANSVDNFMFQNAGYGQFTGVLALRPQELLYAGF